MDFLGIGILSWLTWLPFIGAIVLLLFQTDSEKTRQFASFWSMLCLLLTLLLFHNFDARKGLQYIEDHEWISSIGARYQLGMDGISLILITTTTLLSSITVFLKSHHRQQLVLLFALQTCITGTFLATDFLLLYFFWIASLLLCYFLVTPKSGHREATKFLLCTLSGATAVLLVALKLHLAFPEAIAASPERYESAARLLISEDSSLAGLLNQAHVTGKTFNIWAIQLAIPLLSYQSQLLLFVTLLLGLAANIPTFPLHNCFLGTQNTSFHLLLLPCIIGIYGILRFNLILTQVAPEVLLTVAFVSIAAALYFTLCATAQSDLKLLLSYLYLSQVALAVCGVATLNPKGLDGALLQINLQVLQAGGIHLLLEKLPDRKVSSFNSLARQAPRLAVLFAVLLFGLVGLPPSGSFMATLLLLCGIAETQLQWAIVVGFSMAISSGCVLRLYRRTLETSNGKLQDISVSETTYLLPLAILVIWIGIYPQKVLSYFDTATKGIVRQARVSTTLLQTRK
ncbi:MAG: proton-conducting transporter membrane subunit [Acidobacteriota bacterium]|nr:hypothetical protein [Blastocatellia bacterium]MDW8412091.1 proton-conducting transporter membrane subunit [Acidobacteriota bacterium]